MSDPIYLSDADYIASNGCQCPNCRSTEVQAGEFGMELDMAWRNCSCSDCGAEWTDEYRLAGYGNLDVSKVA